MENPKSLSARRLLPWRSKSTSVAPSSSPQSNTNQITNGNEGNPATDSSSNDSTPESLSQTNPNDSTSNRASQKLQHSFEQSIPAITTNSATVLAAIQSAGDLVSKLPYIKAVAGVLGVVVKVAQEVNTCGKEWNDTKTAIAQIRDIITQFQSHWQVENREPLPAYLQQTFHFLLDHLLEVHMAVEQYHALSSVKRALMRVELTKAATSCANKLWHAVELFQMKMLVKLVTYASTPGETHTPSDPVNVLRCAPPTEYFTGRVEIIQTLSNIFSGPIMTIVGNGDKMEAVRLFIAKNASRFSIVLRLDASASNHLEDDYVSFARDSNAGNTVIDAMNCLSKYRTDWLLVLENADDVSFDLEKFIPRTLHTHVIITSTNSDVSRLASRHGIVQWDGSADESVPNILLRQMTDALAPLQRVATLVAKGGAGKTQTALKFVSESTNRFTRIFFVDASSSETLSANYKTLGKAVNVGESVDSVLTYFANQRDDWLLILDNADNREMNLGSYIPSCAHGNILITSRLADIEQLAYPGCHLAFPDLNEEEAVQLLLLRARQPASDGDNEHAKEIVQRLGNHALAVALAGAYISSVPTCRIATFLLRFQSRQKQMLSFKCRQSLERYEQTVFDTFQLSYERLNMASKLFLRICSFLHNASIPIWMFECAAKQETELLPGEVRPVPLAMEVLTESLIPFREDDGSFEDIIADLNQFSLVSYNDANRTLSFHPLIHDCANIVIDDEPTFHAAAILLLSRARSQDRIETIEYYDLRRQILPHVLRAWDNELQLVALSDYHRLRCVLWDAGQFQTQADMFVKFLALRKEVLGPRHPDTLYSMGALSVTYTELHQWAEAEKLSKEALVLRKEIYGELHPDTLQAMSVLVVASCRLEHWEEAEKAKNELLELCKHAPGPHHRTTIWSMINVGATYRAFERWQQAEEMELETLALCKHELGLYHHHTLLSMAGLVTTYIHLQRWEDAKEIGEEVLNLRLKVLGRHDSETMQSMSDLALIYLHLSQLAKALEQANETLALRKQVLPARHPSILQTISTLARIYWSQGHREDALKCIDTAISEFQSVLDADDSNLTSARALSDIWTREMNVCSPS